MERARLGEAFSAAPFVPRTASLARLARTARGCRGCPLYRDATQTVFGAGPKRARLVLLGEAPGDAEDRDGRPFVGPAGKLLDRALADAGIARTQVYVTNAVKHFKFRGLGKYRLHRNPGGREMRACRPWLEAELALVGPRLVVCLGATAARQMAGRPVLVGKARGGLVPTPDGVKALVTVHPSSLLRMKEGRDEAYARFVADLEAARRLAGAA